MKHCTMHRNHIILLGLLIWNVCVDDAFVANNENRTVLKTRNNNVPLEIGMLKSLSSFGNKKAMNPVDMDATLQLQARAATSATTEKTMISMSSYWNELLLKTESQSDGNRSVIQAASKLNSLFQKLIHVELRAGETEEYYKTLQLESQRTEGVLRDVEMLADKFSSRLKEYEEALNRMENSVKASADDIFLRPNKRNLLAELPICCEIKTDKFLYDQYFKTTVLKDEACKTLPSKTLKPLFAPQRHFSKVLLDNAAKLPHLKWQYFLSPEGVYATYPSNTHNCKTNGTVNRPNFNSDRKLWLMQRSKDDTRNHRIVFLNQLNKMSKAEALKSVKTVVLLLLRFLNEADEVGILNSGSEQYSPHFLCDQMVPVTSWTRYRIMNYFTHFESRPLMSSNSNEMESSEADGDQVSDFQKAIDMACRNFSSESQFHPSAATIIHLTSGLDTTAFTSEHFRVSCPIFIETFSLRPLNQSEEDNYKATLQNVASKNIWRVQVTSTSQSDAESFALKMALKLTTEKEWWSLSDILSQFFPDKDRGNSKAVEFTFPHWNSVSKDAVVVAKKFVFHLNRPLGLVAVEIPLTHFTQHFSYYTNENVLSAKNYAILIDKNGRIIAHPALGRPDISQEVLSQIFIEQIEVRRGFQQLKHKIMSTEKGCESLGLRKEKFGVTYTWAATPGFDYIVILVLFGESGGCAFAREELVLKKAMFARNTDIQHHSLLKKTNFCDNYTFSVNSAALYLSPSAFQLPADAISSQFSSRFNARNNQALMAYIGDNSGSLQNLNRGLRAGVKEHVAALSSIVSPWKFQFFNSKWSKYISRRFATGAGGSFLILYPGSSVSPGYVPSSTTWFRKAVEKETKVVFTAPVVDRLAGVPVSTMSTVIHASSTLVGEPRSGIPIAVVGADVSVGFFQKLIEDVLPECKPSSGMQIDEGNVSTRCFLIDDSGYVVYHPHLSRSLKTTRQVHVTQLEPLTVIDILQHGVNKEIPIRKEMCHRLSEASSTQGSLQRKYSVSLPLVGVQKLKHGEHCSRYHMVPVPDTNLFLTVVYDTCATSSAAFCPCSTVDKLCLNCLRMDPSDCECPCECPREPNFCMQNNVVDLPEDIEPCSFRDESLPMLSQEEDVCRSSTGCNLTCDVSYPKCSLLPDSENCLGSWSCDWCSALNSSATRPMCNSFKSCFDFSSQFEESRLLIDFVPSGMSIGDGSDNDTERSSHTLIPILVVLSVFIVFLGLVAYCYRHRALNFGSSSPELHLLPLQESPMGSILPQAGSSRSDSENEPDPDNVIVPLHIVVPNRNRRRRGRFLPASRSPMGSVVGTDSDHGYSTMTQRDDSECGAPLPQVAMELPSNRVGFKFNSSETTHLQTSTNTSILEPMNSLVVPVVVHAGAASPS